jgi:hypothetical protein
MSRPPFYLVNDDVPDPERVIRDVEKLVPVVYGAIEDGTVLARRFFEDRAEQCETFLFSDLVRYGAKKKLEYARLRVELELVDLANNGLLLGFDGYSIRIRKAYRGEVAVPGSFALEQFHAQTLRLFPDSGRPNLFVLWDVYRPSFALAPDLYVACPKVNTARYPSTADLHWLWKLPNVALLPGEPVAADGFDDYEDLPIRKPETETGTEGA